MTPMDIFDSMLESIQQFPMECNSFERNIKRLHKDHFKYSTRLDRLILKLVPPNDPRLLKLRRKLKNVIKKRLSVTSNFQNAITKQQQRLEELVRISNLDLMNFNFLALPGTACAVIKLNDIPQGNRKYCICNDRAFGFMICCDNPACATKWHHFKCVNLLSPPKTTWICPKCSTVQ